MAISDGMRTHDEGLQPRYRMPDLLTKEEMVLYFASTYGVKVVFEELDDELRDQTMGVGTLPIAPLPTDRDRESVLLRRQLGLTDLEDDLGKHTDRVKELESRTMSTEEFADKYGEQPKPDPEGAFENAEKAREEEARKQEESQQEPPKQSQEAKQPQTSKPDERLDTLLADKKTPKK